ncbi:MAG TPA: sugar phosphate isomerase/epimerase family protein [Limnochordia bacterium]|nr:sugar phosphate isomerase/epimerase family protein [Limnochordia bacterium]
MQITLACNLGCYKQHQVLAPGHLQRLGVRHVEVVQIPPEPRRDAYLVGLAAHGLDVTSVQIPGDIHASDHLARFARDFRAVRQLGARIAFSSVQRGELPEAEAYARLRRVGDLAAEWGVVLSLETHPDLMANAAQGVRTLQGVGHPHVRANFDTANIVYYNQGADVLAELRALLPYVASVHLKDTSGGYRESTFGALGAGVVPVAGAIQLLQAAGFNGPYTMELEGVAGVPDTEATVLARMADSVSYLRGLGVVV